jgi:hypothetical protein
MDKAIIEKVKAAGFDVYMRHETDTWLIFVDGDRLGYLQENRIRGLSTSTVHKANQTTGTGFQVDESLSLSDLTRATLSRAFVHAPDWAYSRDRESVQKYSGIEAYIRASLFNTEYHKI